MTETRAATVEFACPTCRGLVREDGVELACTSCSRRYPAKPFADFLPPGEAEHEELTETHARIHRNEDLGMEHRARVFYKPIFRALGPLESLRVLDDGCGSGKLVDEFTALGMDAWGIDPFNRWGSWSTRQQPERLSRADGCALPFADNSFDIVTSNGVLEHVGHGPPKEAAEDCGLRRMQYVSEALRVLRPGGVFLLGHPNGACPVDFWHGGIRSMRPHAPYESYMPNPREVERYVRSASRHADIETLSCDEYVSFVRTGNDPLGKVLMPAAKAVLFACRHVPRLRRSMINPFLVTRIVKPAN